ncbi:MAG: lysylphosphatidylglycerol synthase transmembrane domain-containing protein [Candidatus Micrarchaeia archaeon]
MNVPARYALYFALCILCLILLALIISSLGLLEPTIAIILSVPLWGLALLLLVTALEFFAKVARFSYCLPARHPLAKLSFPYFFGSFLSFLVPFRLLGEGVRPVVFKMHSGIRYSDSLSAISAERMHDMAFVTLFAAITVGTLLHPLLAFGMVGMLALFVYLVFSGILADTAARLNIRTLSAFAKSYSQSFSKAFSTPARVFAIAALTAIIWLLAFARLWLILCLIGSPLGLVDAGAASSLAYLSSLVSFLPGGILGFEGGGVAVLSYLGAGIEAALAAILLERLFSYWLFIALGPLSALAMGIGFPDKVRA